MTTISEFITFLQTLPQDAEVEVLKEYSLGWSVSTTYEDLDIDKYSDNCELLGSTLYLGNN